MEGAFVNASGMYASWGQHLERLEQFQKCVKFYDEAQKIKAENPTLLTAKSRVMTKATRFKDAISDAEKALAIENENAVAMFMKACGYYGLNEFEKSLVIFHSGAKKRKKPAYFIDGIKQALETIEDCIGIGSGNVMLDYLPAIKALERSKDQAKKQEMPTLQEITATEKKIKFMAYKYLGRMSADLTFLKDLCNDKRVRSANVKHAAEMQEIAENAHAMLTDQLMSSRVRRPLYAIKITEAKSKARMAKKVKENTKTLQEINLKAVKKLMEKSLAAMKEKNAQLCVDYMDRAKRYINSKNTRELPEKIKLLEKIYQQNGDLILAQKRLNMKMNESDNENRVHFLLGYPIARRGSQDSVLKYYPVSYRNKQEYIKSVGKVLEGATSTMEQLYCYHELSETYCQERKHNLSMFYASKLVTSARAIKNDTWELNGMFMMIRNYVIQHNKNEARIAIKELIDTLREKKGYRKVMTFAEMVQYLNDKSPEEIIKNDEEERMQKIIDLMIDEDVTKEIKLLFKKMTKMPDRRRFSVIPINKKAEKPKPSDAKRTILDKEKSTHKPVLPKRKSILGKPTLK